MLQIWRRFEECSTERIDFPVGIVGFVDKFVDQGFEPLVKCLDALRGESHAWTGGIDDNKIIFTRGKGFCKLTSGACQYLQTYRLLIHNFWRKAILENAGRSCVVFGNDAPYQAACHDFRQ